MYIKKIPLPITTEVSCYPGFPQDNAGMKAAFMVDYKFIKSLEESIYFHIDLYSRVSPHTVAQASQPIPPLHPVEHVHGAHLLLPGGACQSHTAPSALHGAPAHQNISLS